MSLAEAPRQHANRLLAALSPENYERLTPHLESFHLKHSAVLAEIGDRMEYVYFLTSGMISLVSHTDEGGTLEVGITGYEGFVGLSVFLGVDDAQYRLLVQGEGEAFRIKAKTFKAECHRETSLHTIMLRYTQALMTQITQAAICNRYHDVEARLCRWLLQSQDCMRSSELQLTQDFLAMMLGVHRPGVTIAAGILQSAGLIQYNRGHITILDRNRLESASCDCYRVIKEAFSWLPDA
jgi:CRP-like cAMP-binding protein